ncbi:hypothetical protein FBEOM_5913 [Fusarium beomiforme]|uniref:Uncharacterized protein n=1 Tax=Fusarium beomiforme TaxID=44412 RepID=A0A9P5AKE2_9HYPO|nr:hypothetical protein FBEOM_5913 [Fusarium beomiforme]
MDVPTITVTPPHGPAPPVPGPITTPLHWYHDYCRNSDVEMAESKYSDYDGSFDPENDGIYDAGFTPPRLTHCPTPHATMTPPYAGNYSPMYNFVGNDVEMVEAYDVQYGGVYHEFTFECKAELEREEEEEDYPDGGCYATEYEADVSEAEDDAEDEEVVDCRSGDDFPDDEDVSIDDASVVDDGVEDEEPTEDLPRNDFSGEQDVSVEENISVDGDVSEHEDASDRDNHSGDEVAVGDDDDVPIDYNASVDDYVPIYDDISGGDNFSEDGSSGYDALVNDDVSGDEPAYSYCDHASDYRGNNTDDGACMADKELLNELFGDDENIEGNNDWKVKRPVTKFSLLLPRVETTTSLGKRTLDEFYDDESGDVKIEDTQYADLELGIGDNRTLSNAEKCVAHLLECEVCRKVYSNSSIVSEGDGPSQGVAPEVIELLRTLPTFPELDESENVQPQEDINGQYENGDDGLRDEDSPYFDELDLAMAQVNYAFDECGN